MKEISFEGSVCLDESGEIVCFCYADEDRTCACSNNPNCYSATMNVTLLNRKSLSNKLELASKKISTNLKSVETKIKEGISTLEKAINRNKNFRI